MMAIQEIRLDVRFESVVDEPHEPMTINAGFCGGCDYCGLTEQETLCDTCGCDVWDCEIAAEKMMEMS
nr:hypothetical protein [Rhodococcus sp. (in: high G+C Gram-positive bacteria)]